MYRWEFGVTLRIVFVMGFLALILAFFITMGMAIYTEGKKMSEDCFVVGKFDFDGVLGGVFVFVFFNALFVFFNAWPGFIDEVICLKILNRIVPQLKSIIAFILIMLNLYSLYLVIKSVSRKLKVVGDVVYVDRFLFEQNKLSFSEIIVAKAISEKNYQGESVKVVTAFKNYSELFAVSSDMYGYDILIKRLKDKNLLQYDTPTES